jgi:hypothetical protein
MSKSRRPPAPPPDVAAHPTSSGDWTPVDVARRADLQSRRAAIADISPQLAAELAGLRVTIDADGEATLLRTHGNTVDTWREGYPYPERMRRAEYDREKAAAADRAAQAAELGQGDREKLVIRFEGRDAAGKGRDHQAVHRAPESAGRPGRRAGEAPGAREHPLVLPALHRSPARRRGDRPVRPVLVQPGGRRASHGVSGTRRPEPSRTEAWLFVLAISLRSAVAGADPRSW